MTECALTPPPVVDTHAHVFTRGMPLAERAWTRPDYDFTAEQFLAALDQHGMGFGVIAAVTLVEVLAHGRDLPELLPVLEASDVKVVIDHLADPDRQLGVESPGFLAALRSIDSGRCHRPHGAAAVFLLSFPRHHLS